MKPLEQGFHAVLIGIDDYRSTVYGPLRGAVNDVEALRTLLHDEWGAPQQAVRTLIAPRNSEEAPRDEDLPTYANMTNAIRQLGERAEPEDQVLIYFSGHGARFPTRIPDRRDEDGLDKALVPVDIDGAEKPGAPLRDLELAHLIEGLAERELLVTLVLDCCHSGGSLRDARAGDSTIRGGEVDLRERPLGSVASSAELSALWERLPRLRDAEVWSGWRLPAAAVVTAACRAHEVATEQLVDRRMRGIFTYWWLDCLQRRGFGQTYRQVQERLVGKVLEALEGQSPTLEGDTDRQVFGRERRPMKLGIRVLAVDEAKREVYLGAGRGHGLGPGALVRLDLGQETPALFRIGDLLDSTRSIALPLEATTPLPETGDQLFLTDPGDAAARQRVSLGDGLAEVLPEDVLEETQRAIAASGFLELVESDANLLLRVEDGSLGIFDSTGQQLLSLHGLTRAQEVVERLEHLAELERVLALKNGSEESQLDGVVQLRFLRPPPDWQPRKRIFVERGEELTPPVTVGDGDVVWLVVENNSQLAINYAVFDLRPDWSCRRLIPGDRDTATLPSKRHKAFPLSLRYFESDRPCRDVFKLVASVDQTDFSWLELPVPGEPKLGLRDFPRPLVTTAWQHWTTHQLTFEVRPPNP